MMNQSSSFANLIWNRVNKYSWLIPFTAGIFLRVLFLYSSSVLELLDSACGLVL